jgi:hypothetical protein
MTIPRKMYSFQNPNYKTMDGMEQPDYFDREAQAVGWNIKVKRSNFLEDDWKDEREHLARIGEKDKI